MERKGINYKSLNILENQKSFLNEITFLIVFEASSFGKKIKLWDTTFKYLSQEFDSKLDLVKKKGFYPDVYMSGFENFEELASKEKFYSSLAGKITDTEYEHALKVWDRFEMKMNNNYHHLSLYLKSDVSLLAGMFEKFTNSSLKNYILCMIHYLSAPTLSWDAMLNMTKVELELISDVGMYLFFEKSMRTRVSKRHSKANNQYLKSYDPKQESKHICSVTYNTYGYAMCKFFQLCELHNDYLLSPDIK